jgi:hypothetical protein
MTAAVTIRSEADQMAVADAIPAPTPSTRRSEAREDFLSGVVTTALEGGIGYWSVARRYRWDGVPSAYAVIVPTGEYDIDGVPSWGVWDDADPREVAPILIDTDLVARGARLFVEWLEEKNWDRSHYFWQFVAANKTNYEQGDYDAEVADMVVQFGCFGEPVFG